MKRFLLLTLLVVSASAHTQSEQLQDGDIVFQTSKSTQSVAVQKATGSRYSHMGIVINRSGVPHVFEAAGTVRYTPLRQWVSRGVNGHFVVKRLQTAASTFTPASITRFQAIAKTFEGRPYDLTFEWSDNRIYCSELVWKIYERAFGIRIGELQKAKEFNLSDPVVRKKMQERYGDHFPTEEPVISPVSMYESPLLVTVLEK